MNDKLVDFLIEKTDAFGEVINELAKQLGVAAEHVYSVIVKQQYVEGISGLIGAGLIAILALVLLISSFKSRKKLLEKGHYDGSDIIAVRWAGMAIGFLVMGGMVFWAIDALKMLLNPEFYAIQDIMEMIRGELDSDD
jgi:hypothetical protein